MKRLAALSLVVGTMVTSGLAFMSPAQAYNGNWRRCDYRYERCHRFEGYHRGYFAPTLGQRIRWNTGL